MNILQTYQDQEDIIFSSDSIEDINARISEIVGSDYWHIFEYDGLVISPEFYDGNDYYVDPVEEYFGVWTCHTKYSASLARIPPDFGHDP
jgi:hypothetical protein